MCSELENPVLYTNGRGRFDVESVVEMAAARASRGAGLRSARIANTSERWKWTCLLVTVSVGFDVATHIPQSSVFGHGSPRLSGGGTFVSFHSPCSICNALRSSNIMCSSTTIMYESVFSQEVLVIEV